MSKAKNIIFAAFLLLPLSASGSSDEELVSYAKENIAKFVNQYSLCDKLEDIKLLDVKTGTVNKATESRKLLPAIVARVDFVCVRNIEGSKTHIQMYEVLALDHEFDMVRCLKLSDEEDSVKKIAELCGFSSK